jgi:hypothetical protein
MKSSGFGASIFIALCRELVHYGIRNGHVVDERNERMNANYGANLSTSQEAALRIVSG